MMLATGTLYLTSRPPLATKALDGTFVLTMYAVDRINAMQVEPWLIT